LDVKVTDLNNTPSIYAEITLYLQAFLNSALDRCEIVFSTESFISYLNI